MQGSIDPLEKSQIRADESPPWLGCLIPHALLFTAGMHRTLLDHFYAVLCGIKLDKDGLGVGGRPYTL